MATIHKPVILVVDDEPSITTTLQMILEGSGYNVETAETGRAATDMLPSVVFDLALVDVHLPDLDGITVAREICKKLPRCKILLITGSTEGSELVVAARKDGLEFEVLPKPIPPAELLKHLSQLLERPEN